MTTTEVSLRVYDLRCDDDDDETWVEDTRDGARCDAMR